MKKDTPYVVTEWDWLKFRLQLHALWIRSEMYSVDFDFEREDGKIGCLIYGGHAATMIEEKAPHEVQLEYYHGWVQMEKNVIADVLKGLPTLGRELDLERDVVFVIMNWYGMGSTPVCEIVGNQVTWKVPKRGR